MNNIEKLSVLLQARKRLLPTLLANSENDDKEGSSTNLLGLSHRFLGVAEFVVNGDTAAFRNELSRSAMCRRALLERFDSGEAISPSYASMTLSCASMLDALAAGNLKLATHIASIAGGRVSIEREFDQRFYLNFGYALRSVILRLDDIDSALSAFRSEAQKERKGCFLGYADALVAIRSGSLGHKEEAIDSIISGHKHLVSRGGIFKGSEDEFLCVWGIGITNLMIIRGADLTIDNPLIPNRLLAPQGADWAD